MEICEYVPPENDLLLRDDNFVMYHAFKVDRIHIYYRCADCFKTSTGRIVNSPYKKNGKPYKNLKANIHRHGSNSCWKTRTEDRSPHGDVCLNKKNVKIVIDHNKEKDLS